MRWFRPLLSIAAVLLLLVASIYIFQKPANPDALYNTYYEPYPMINVVRGNPIQNDLAALYEAQNWEGALELLEQKEDANMARPMRDIYRAICNLELGNIDGAINILRQYQDSPVDPIYQE